MKTRLMLAFTALVSSSVLAQTVTNVLTPAPAAPAPAPVTVAAPAKPEKKPAAAPAQPAPAKKKAVAQKKVAPKPAAAAPKKPAAPAVPLVPGPATVNTDNVNVRGQAKLSSERVAQLKSGDTVTVLEEIILDKPAVDEPARWARISLPAGTKVWVNTMFVDTKNKTVTSRRLNLRSGPGENFSIVGLIEKGDEVTEAGAVKGDWMQIDAPKTAYAFVASQYLKQEAPAATLVAATPPPQPAAPVVPPPQPVPVETTPAPQPAAVTPEPAPVTPPPTETAPAKEPPIVAATLEPALFKDVPATPAPQPDSEAVAKSREALRETMADMAARKVPTHRAKADEPLPPRIVSHEGVVRSSWSVQAPTPYILVNPATSKTINYLYTTSTNLNLANYKGLRIVVTGEEALDSRWKSTPVLTIQRIQVIE